MFVPVRVVVAGAVGVVGAVVVVGAERVPVPPPVPLPVCATANPAEPRIKVAAKKSRFACIRASLAQKDATSPAHSGRAAPIHHADEVAPSLDAGAVPNHSEGTAVVPSPSGDHADGSSDPTHHRPNARA